MSLEELALALRFSPLGGYKLELIPGLGKLNSGTWSPTEHKLILSLAMNDYLWSANGCQGVEGPTPGLKVTFMAPLGGVYIDVKLGPIIMLLGILLCY